MYEGMHVLPTHQYSQLGNYNKWHNERIVLISSFAFRHFLLSNTESRFVRYLIVEYTNTYLSIGVNVCSGTSNIQKHTFLRHKNTKKHKTTKL